MVFIDPPTRNYLDNVFGSANGQVTTTSSGGVYSVQGYFFINDIAIWDHDNDPGYRCTAKVYLLSLPAQHSRMASTLLEQFDIGLYKSTGMGTTGNIINIFYNDGAVREHINEIINSGSSTEFG